MIAAIFYTASLQVFSKTEKESKQNPIKEIIYGSQSSEVRDNEIKIDHSYLNELDVNQIFDSELVFIDIDSEIDTSISIGTVTVNYITKDNKKLIDTVTMSNLIGVKYETVKKILVNIVL